MWSNESCKGYVQKALQYMIDKKEIDIELAKKVMNNVNWEFSLLSVPEAETYYQNNFLRDNA